MPVRVPASEPKPSRCLHVLGVSGLACLLALGCRTPLFAPRAGPPKLEPVPGLARVDLERVRAEAKIDADLAILLVAHAVAEAQQLELAETRTSFAVDITDDVLAALARAPLAKLSWLAGAWQGQADGATTTERWCPGVDGTLFGYNTTEHGGSRVAFEWLTIAQQPTGIVYLAQPEGRTPATPFTHVEGDGARFENPSNDFPQRLQYTRDGEALHVTVSAGDKKLEWTWKPAGDLAALAKACALVRARKHL